jgi:L-ribulose-5-phosphate 4-epimerase
VSDDMEKLKAQLVRSVDMLFTAGVMQYSAHANLSARLDGERIILSSGGTIRGLTIADLAVVSFDGKVLDGDMEPTAAEIVGMHVGVYRARPRARAVIHTHSPHATAFALAHEPLPCAYEALLRFGVAEPIPVADWAPRGSPESVGNIVQKATEHPTVPAVLLGNHGLLAWGADPIEAARLVVAMEEAARVTLDARRLGGEKPFPPGALEWEQRRMAEHRSRV